MGREDAFASEGRYSEISGNKVLFKIRS